MPKQIQLQAGTRRPPASLGRLLSCNALSACFSMSGRVAQPHRLTPAEAATRLLGPHLHEEAMALAVCTVAQHHTTSFEDESPRGLGLQPASMRWEPHVTRHLAVPYSLCGGHTSISGLAAQSGDSAWQQLQLEPVLGPCQSSTPYMSHVQDLLDTLGTPPPGYEWEFGTGEDAFDIDTGEDMPEAAEQDENLEDIEEFEDEAAFAQGSQLWADLRESIMPSSSESGYRALTHVEALREQGELYRMMQVQWEGCQ